MSNGALTKAIAAVPGGAWGVGVSGGADSVALLWLLLQRCDIQCRAIHLDHQTRNGQSQEDADFVERLCHTRGVPCTIVRRSELEHDTQNLPTNRSARFRALRLVLFRSQCQAHHLQGVILAHHADDQAETIFQRLLRGSGPAGLSGMRARTTMGGLTILRPLLDVPSMALRELLVQERQEWREDASNASPNYQRNRVRPLLRSLPTLADSVRAMGAAMDGLAEWTRACAPRLPEAFLARELANCPDVLASEAARQWLAGRGAPLQELSPPVLARLLNMARDAASAPRQFFPGRLLVRRRGGRVDVVQQSERAPVA